MQEESWCAGIQYQKLLHIHPHLVVHLPQGEEGIHVCSGNSVLGIVCLKCMLWTELVNEWWCFHVHALIQCARACVGMYLEMCTCIGVLFCSCSAHSFSTCLHSASRHVYQSWRWCLGTLRRVPTRGPWWPQRREKGGLCEVMHVMCTFYINV